MRLINTAREQMESIIHSFNVVRTEDVDPRVHSSALEIPKNHPRLWPQGSNAVIFGLDPVIDTRRRAHHYCGKLFTRSEGTWWCIPFREDYLYSGGKPCGFRNGGLSSTTKVLREIGYAPTQQNEFWAGRYFVIASDLTKGGRFSVDDASEFPFETLTNGEVLREEYEQSVQNIYEAVQTDQYDIRCAGHGSTKDPREAIEQMFLVQYDQEKSQGSLHIADLNHLIICKNS